MENDTAALIQDGRTYLPIRVVLESFGAKVQWNGDTNTVVVTSGGQTTGNGDIQVHFLDVGQGTQHSSTTASLKSSLMQGYLQKGQRLCSIFQTM